MKRYVFDACALVAFFNDESGADVVESLLLEASQAVVEQATLVTSDHHEMDLIEKDGKLNFYWVR